MRISWFVSFLGFILLIAGTYCPLLRPFGLVSWDVYGLNKPYGMVLLLIGVVGVLGTALSNLKLVKLSAWLSLTLVALLLLAAVLKVNTSFSFVPFKSVAGFLSRQIKFKWGWYLLFAGPIIALIGAFSSRQLVKKQ